MALLFILDTLSTSELPAESLRAAVKSDSALVILVGISTPVKNSEALSASSVYGVITSRILMSFCLLHHQKALQHPTKACQMPS